MHKARDRSHYERFRHYHETFYRSVEPPSVTPFSARALDRGFAGAFVALARHMESALTPPRGAQELGSYRAALEERLTQAFGERLASQPLDDLKEREEAAEAVRRRVVDLLDSWVRIVEDYRTSGVQVQYQQYEDRGPKPLLRYMLDQDFESAHHRKFRANRSLRDVEPEVHLYVKDLKDARGPA